MKWKEGRRSCNIEDRREGAVKDEKNCSIREKYVEDSNQLETMRILDELQKAKKEAEKLRRELDK